MKKEKTGIIKKYAVHIYCTLLLLLLVSVLSAVRGPHGLFGYTVRVVVSGSMEPTIMTDTVNIIKICNIDDVEVGDIVCYRYDRDIIHRIIEKTNTDGITTLRTKGDANRSADDVSITDDMVIGKVVKTLNWTRGLVSKFSIAPGRMDVKSIYKAIIVTSILLVGIQYIASRIYKYLVICSYTFRGITKAEQRVKLLNTNMDKLSKECSRTIEFSNRRVENYENHRIVYMLHVMILALMEYKLKSIDKKVSKERYLLIELRNMERKLYNKGVDDVTNKDDNTTIEN